MSLTGWDPVAEKRRKLLCDDEGRLIVVPEDGVGYGVGSKMMMDLQIAATQPPEVTTRITGVGTVTFTANGAILTPGVAAGDDAVIYVHNLPLLGRGATSGVLKMEFLVSINDTPAETDIAIGMCSVLDPQDVTDVAYFDPTAGNVRVDAVTAAIVYPTMKDWAHWFRVEIDLDASETRFYIDDVLVETIASVPTLGEYIGVFTESRGAGAEIVYVWYIRYSWETS